MKRYSENALAYTVEQAAELCGVSGTLIHRAVKAGLLPAKRTSRNADGIPTGLTLILRKDLEKWLEGLPDDQWGPRYP